MQYARSTGELPVPLPIVCLAFGDFHGMTELYVSRLFGMLSRHCPQPFTLYCYTDRLRQLPTQIVQRDCAAWTELVRSGMRNTTLQLGLFNPRYVEFDRFLYLDLSLVVRRDMSDLLAHAFARPEDLVNIPHWRGWGYNASVMRIHCGGLAAVYDAFVAGESFEQHRPGAQDFIRGVVLRHALQERVGYFTADQIISFKRVVRMCRRSPAQARRLVEQATIVKFHGSPKMHEAFTPRFRMRVRLRELMYGSLRPVIPMLELQREWQGDPAAERHSPELLA
jgi:hypothetical protein